MRRSVKVFSQPSPVAPTFDHEALSGDEGVLSHFSMC